MSEFRDALSDIVADRQAGTAELCVNLANGVGFIAEVETIQDQELNTDLGRDHREQILLHVDRANAALANLANLGKVTVSLFGRLAKFQVLRIKDNPADPQVEYGLMKLIPGKDS